LCSVLCFPGFGFLKSCGSRRLGRSCRSA
jgi:hypothetical protein